MLAANTMRELGPTSKSYYLAECRSFPTIYEPLFFTNMSSFGLLKTSFMPIRRS
jgi:hypothetical protein